jgi:hypothetical protein
LPDRDPVLVGIASIPERVESLERTIASLAPQADWIAVSLNGHTEIPRFLHRYSNVEAVLRPKNGGDAEKFAAVADWDGYVATCDDDLLYPADYIDTLVAGIDRYDRLRAVSFHGGTTNGWNARTHGAATVKRIRCLGSLDVDDTDVNAVGTGVLGWHTSRIPVWRELFRSPNMADVYFACHAYRFGIPLAVLAHNEGWLRDIQPAGPSIYESNRAADGSTLDTRDARKGELDRIDWTVPPVRPKVRVSIATCERPQLLDDLLSDLERKAGRVDIEVAVYQDHCTDDYHDAHERVIANGWSWHRFPSRLGREEHWRLIDRELGDCRESAADWFVFLPDDVRLARLAICEAIDIYDRLDDPSTLTLWRLKDHEGQPNWTGLLPVEREHAFEVFHVDGIYLCRRDTLEFLNYSCPKPNPSRRRPTSSGVGRAMSLHLHAAGKRMYRVHKTLAAPVIGVPSVMNPDCGDRRYPGVAL